jgi:hypothetical protein
MQTLLTMVVTWLSINMALPAIYDPPRIEWVPSAEMDTAHLGHPPDQLPDLTAEVPRQNTAVAVEALYDDTTRTLYLSENWTGITPAEVSVLVHEMVHHLQNLAGLKYECPQAREKAAYEAQDKWLALFGSSLMDEFKLDRMTLLVRTKCMH